MLSLSLHIQAEEAREKCLSVIADGSAKRKLCEMVRAQGGDASYIEDTEKFPRAETVRKVLSPEDGYLSHMDAEKIGIASSLLGAGREKKEDSLDMTAGIVLCMKTGDYVKKGDVLAELHTSTRDTQPAKKMFLSALAFSEIKPDSAMLIYNVIR
jgi:pyrimidine-nucleoside phosphorylase